MTETTAPEENPADPRILNLRHAVRYAYDLQQMRIAQGNRAGPKAEHAPAALDDKHIAFLQRASEGLEGLEKDAFKEVKRLLKVVPIYNEWLKDQKGVGPAMAGVLLSYFDIHRADTPSKMWMFCGLAVDNSTGQSVRRKKGEKAKFNPWLKAKMTQVLGGSFIKSNSPWRYFYDNYKVRKQNQRVPKCMLCEGSGKYDKKPCSNCEGTGGPAPWGRSDAHRHAAALRYMVKMFLLEFWIQWRTLEGLPVRNTYAEEYLGRRHHGHKTPGETLAALEERAA